MLIFRLFCFPSFSKRERLPFLEMMLRHRQLAKEWRGRRRKEGMRIRGCVSCQRHMSSHFLIIIIVPPDLRSRLPRELHRWNLQVKDGARDVANDLPGLISHIFSFHFRWWKRSSIKVWWKRREMRETSPTFLFSSLFSGRNSVHCTH